MRLINYALLLSLLPATAMAQSATDAMSLQTNQLMGTARFVSMAGAFGALGGDLSTLTQNPAGIGVYRSSDIGVTLDINFQNTNTSGQGANYSVSQTKAYCPNFGYVGVWKTGSDVMPYFNWGISYGRRATFDRKYNGAWSRLGTPGSDGKNLSLSNYIASFTNGWDESYLQETSQYDPWIGDSYTPWLSILGYQAAIINPTSQDTYQGLANYNGTSNVGAAIDVFQKGYIDEYSINFGGNIQNTVYWGLGVGIKDISLSQWTTYSENITDGIVPYEPSAGSAYGTAPGSGSFRLNTYRHLSGSGADLKLGIIVKPVNELRLGLAVHTPTWYSMESVTNADMQANFNATVGTHNYNLNRNVLANYGEDDYYDWKFNSPWRMMVSAAGVIGGKGIISLDYEYDAYNKMAVKNYQGYQDDIVKEDIANYTRAVSTLRLGAEYRVTPSFSLRAGYSYSTSPTKGTSTVLQQNASAYNIDTDGPDDMGTQPSYKLDRTTQYVTCGLGYRYQMLYLDAAYVYRMHDADLYPWSTSQQPLKVSDHDSSLVITAGLRF